MNELEICVSELHATWYIFVLECFCSRVIHTVVDAVWSDSFIWNNFIVMHFVYIVFLWPRSYF